MTIASRFFELTMKLPPASNRDVQVERDVRILMPDGVQLLADRYFPRGDGRPPLVLVRSPYGRRGIWGLLFGRVLAEHGFQVLIQSCRGTFGSGGTLDPFGPGEHDDGLATVAWMREQPWYPGAFATTGVWFSGRSPPTPGRTSRRSARR
jgi:putative CocE/NonD family hydrolase